MVNNNKSHLYHSISLKIKAHCSLYEIQSRLLRQLLLMPGFSSPYWQAESKFHILRAGLDYKGLSDGTFSKPDVMSVVILSSLDIAAVVILNRYPCSCHSWIVDSNE